MLPVDSGLPGLPPAPDSTWLLSLEADQLAAREGLGVVEYPGIPHAGVALLMKRDECLHPVASGNKLYKLWGHLRAAQRLGARGVYSFGGYYSNHLHALAWVGHEIGMPTHGFVRGHAPHVLSPTLQDCQRWGMQLHFLSRVAYRDACDGLTGPSMPQDFYVIPEGGGGAAGQQGCEALGRWLASQVDANTTLCVATGTGTTLAGILRGLGAAPCKVMAFSALRLGEQLPDYRQQLLRAAGVDNSHERLSVEDEQYFGGFGRSNAELLHFMTSFEAATGIALDPVYTGKMMHRIGRLLEQGFWSAGQKLVILHSGGLQGRRGVPLVAVSDFANGNMNSSQNSTECSA